MVSMAASLLDIRVQDIDHCGIVAGICDEMNLVQTIDNQLGKPTTTPTLRWVFQCFMSIHLVTIAQTKQIANLTEERCWILKFFGAPCRKYYLLC
jgi:hypothetical protein